MQIDQVKKFNSREIAKGENSGWNEEIKSETKVFFYYDDILW